LGQRVFKNDENFRRRFFSAGERVFQDQIVRRKNVFGEKNAQRPGDLNGAFDGGHVLI